MGKDIKYTYTIFSNVLCNISFEIFTYKSSEAGNDKKIYVYYLYIEYIPADAAAGSCNCADCNRSAAAASSVDVFGRQVIIVIGAGPLYIVCYPIPKSATAFETTLSIRRTPQPRPSVLIAGFATVAGILGGVGGGKPPARSAGRRVPPSSRALHNKLYFNVVHVYIRFFRVRNYCV